jgi:copper chaperone CopZ
VVSLPLYVCATASVPIAAALVASGMPPGAALVFLMAGPATNVATLGAVYRSLGRRALAIYLGTIVAGSLVAALVFDFVLEAAPVVVPHDHRGHGLWVAASALLLLGLIVWFAIDDLLRLWRRRSAARQADSPAIEVGVVGMTCENCVSKLERALRAERGVSSAVVTLEPARAVVRGSIDGDQIRRIVERAGFGVKSRFDARGR